MGHDKSWDTSQTEGSSGATARPGQASRRRRGGERGAALVEFAIIAPLLFGLIIGVFSGGLSMSRKNSMTNAVREGSRLGATLAQDGGWADAVRDRVIDLAAGDLTPSQVCVSLVEAPSTVVRASSCDPMVGSAPAITGIAAGDCVVLVWARRTTEIQAIIFAKDITLDASTASRYERECGP
jgi:hypothetical protein